MAYEIPGFTVGVLPANIDLSAQDTYQYTGVKVVAANGTTVEGADGAAVDTPAGSGDPVLGILQNNPLLDEAATVMVHGVSKARIQGSVAVGDQLMTVPGGKFAVATSSKYQVAQALEAGVSGDLITVVLIRNGLKA